MKSYSILILSFLTFPLGFLPSESAVAADRPVLKQQGTDDRKTRDPFLLPRGVYSHSTKPNDKAVKNVEVPSMEVGAILISDRVRLASINRQIVTVGDAIEGEKVVEIQSDRVVLGTGDKRRSLFLKQGPIRSNPPKTKERKNP